MADHINSADTGAHDTSIDQDVSQAHGTVVDKDNKKNDAGMAQIKIEHVIPTSGQRKPTTKKEYWLWVIYVSCSAELMAYISLWIVGSYDVKLTCL